MNFEELLIKKVAENIEYWRELKETYEKKWVSKKIRWISLEKILYEILPKAEKIARISGV